MAKKKATKDVFDLSMAEKVIRGEETGIDLLDRFTSHRSSLVGQILYMDIDDYQEHAYAERSLALEPVRDKDLDLTKMYPPIIDIVHNRGEGMGRSIVARAQGNKFIPVVVLANKLGQIEWWLERTGIKLKKD